MKFNKIPKNLRPREKALKYGVRHLNDREILALFLRTGYQKTSVLNLAQKLIDKIEGLQNLSKLNLNTIVQIKGIGIAKALEILASFELVRRVKLLEQNKKNKHLIRFPCDIYNLLKYDCENNEKEHFYIILLDKNNILIKQKMLYKGTKNRILIDIKDILKFILTNSGDRFICVHNHPSGDSHPSFDDLKTNNEIIKISSKINLTFIDHIIIGKNQFYSIALKQKFHI